MDVTPNTIAKFRESLLERGLSEGTARCYSLLVGRCARDAGARGLATRLTESDLAPKSLRSNRAALMAWATFAEDAPLLLKVKRVRLPPSARVKTKVKITPDQWKEIVRAIRVSDETEAMRSILLLVAARGFRVGDVMRMRKAEISTALRTGKLSFMAKGRKRLETDVTPIRPMLQTLFEHRRWETVEDLIIGSKCRSVGFARRHQATCRAREALERVVKKAGLRIKPHDLRRMYALSFLKRLDRDPQSLQKLATHMGWSGIAMAALYADEVNRDELDQVGNDMAGELLE